VNDANCATKALMMFVYGNVRYPEEAEAYGTEGMAVISFVIEKDGSVSNPSITRDPGDGIGEEGLRIVNLMIEQDIRWQPGTQGGEAVRVKFNLPVKFKLTD
jgi:protein TonB